MYASWGIIQHQPTHRADPPGYAEIAAMTCTQNLRAAYPRLICGHKTAGRSATHAGYRAANANKGERRNHRTYAAGRPGRVSGLRKTEVDPIGAVHIAGQRPNSRLRTFSRRSIARWLAAVACMVLPLQCGASAPSLFPATPSPEPPDAEQQADATDIASEQAALGPMSVERAFAPLSFDDPVQLAYADDGTSRLFVVEQPGRIMALDNDRGAASASVFLDIRDRVRDAGVEEGLLGLAFDPEFRTNGHLFVYYSASGPRRSVLSRFSASAANPDSAEPDSEVVVMEFLQPYSNHNGGQILFGPDGNLYIGLGDGGGGGDPEGNGQDLSTLLGSVLRIDVSSSSTESPYRVPSDNPFVDGRPSGARPEIWAYGLRNPWRFTFDRETGDLWAGDVGQNRFEEIDIIMPGRNYGWNVMEGSHCFPSDGVDCDPTGFESPVADYAIGENGCSVIGGYVYRGPRHPSLLGAYMYGDFCSGRIWALRHDGEQVTEQLELVDTDLQISAFGEDQEGELYVISYRDGRLYRLVPQ